MGKQRRERKARTTGGIDPTEALAPQARTESISIVLAAIHRYGSYGSKSALSIHIRGQLGSNLSYAYPHFTDYSDLGVESFMVDGVKSMLLDKNIIHFRSASLSLPTIVPASPASRSPLLFSVNTTPTASTRGKSRSSANFALSRFETVAWFHTSRGRSSAVDNAPTKELFPTAIDSASSSAVDSAIVAPTEDVSHVPIDLTSSSSLDSATLIQTAASP
jgi:hypothetical protein